MPQLEVTGTLAPATMDRLATEIGNQLCLRYLTSGPPYATVQQAKQALRDAALAARDVLNIHGKVFVLLMIYLFTSLPANARYTSPDTSLIAKSWSDNLDEIRNIIYMEGPASFGVFNATCLIDGPRDATPTQIMANIQYLIGLNMRFLFLCDPVTVG
jgi:hypothetical protein